MSEASPTEQSPTTAASRRAFLSVGAAGAMAAVLSACGSGGDPETAQPGATAAYAPKGGSDALLVNFLLKLEYAENEFYSQVVEAGVFSARNADLFRRIESNEREHIGKLEDLAGRLDGPAPERPSVDFPQLSQGPRAVLRLAATLENLGAGAYLGQVPQAVNREVMAAVLSIHTIEARHAAKLNRLIGEEFRPHGPFASPVEMQEVNSALAPFVAG